MIKCSCNVTVHAIQADLLHIANRKTKVKKKEKKYINFSNHWNSAVDIAADTGWPVITEMNGKPILGKGYRSCFNHFLLNV